MEITWNNKEPIYLQLRDRLVALIMDGVFPEGDALPSVRQIAGEQRINPITVSKAFQILVDEELVEKNGGWECMLLKERKTNLRNSKGKNFSPKNGRRSPAELKDWVWSWMTCLASQRLIRAKLMGMRHD